MTCSVDRTDEFFALVTSMAAARRIRTPQRWWPKPKSVLQQAVDALSTQSIDPRQALCTAISEIKTEQDNASNAHARLHWFEVERIFVHWQRPETPAAVAMPSRADELRFLQYRLEQVNTQYTIVTQLLAEHNSKLALVDRSVDRIAIRIDASADELSDAAPRRYKVRRWQMCPRSLPGKMRCAFGSVVLLNLVLIYLAIL